MNLDSLSFDLSQINYSVANVTKKNLKSSIQELASVSVNLIILFIRLSKVEFQDCKPRLN